MNPSRIVIGLCCDGHSKLLVDLYAVLRRRILICKPTESELIKIVSNSLRAVNISFWNELHILCQKLGVDTKTIADGANPSKVLGEWEGGDWGTRFFGEPYGGKCLPKDMDHLSDAFRKYGLNPATVEAAQRINGSIRGGGKHDRGDYPAS
jgi:UDP-glucose 6-dehydrogenase